MTKTSKKDPEAELAELKKKIAELEKIKGISKKKHAKKNKKVDSSDDEAETAKSAAKKKREPKEKSGPTREQLDLGEDPIPVIAKAILPFLSCHTPAGPVQKGSVGPCSSLDILNLFLAKFCAKGRGFVTKTSIQSAVKHLVQKEKLVNVTKISPFPQFNKQNDYKTPGIVVHNVLSINANTDVRETTLEEIKEVLDTWIRTEDFPTEVDAKAGRASFIAALVTASCCGLSEQPFFIVGHETAKWLSEALGAMTLNQFMQQSATEAHIQERMAPLIFAEVSKNNKLATVVNVGEKTNLATFAITTGIAPRVPTIVVPPLTPPEQPPVVLKAIAQNLLTIIGKHFEKSLAQQPEVQDMKVSTVIQYALELLELPALTEIIFMPQERPAKKENAAGKKQKGEAKPKAKKAKKAKKDEDEEEEELEETDLDEGELDPDDMSLDSESEAEEGSEEESEESESGESLGSDSDADDESDEEDEASSPIVVKPPQKKRKKPEQSSAKQTKAPKELKPKTVEDKKKMKVHKMHPETTQAPVKKKDEPKKPAPSPAAAPAPAPAPAPAAKTATDEDDEW
jgi:hypothetical protein